MKLWKKNYFKQIIVVSSRKPPDPSLREKELIEICGFRAYPRATHDRIMIEREEVRRERRGREGKGERWSSRRVCAH